MAFIAALLSGTPAFAATPAPGWNVDKAHSKVAFTAAMNGQPLNGTFRRFDARIAFDPNNLAGSSVTAVIDTASAATGDATRDQSLPTPDWFNTRAFPQATFRSSAFKALGNGRYVADGTLTIRGVSRRASLPFKLVITGKLAHMDGNLTIDRRWFGIGQGQFAGTEAVAGAVKVSVALNATRK
ncbi:YceI family protein [Novosphingobium profundi]|uniref:YceI family protein n=1 Tax=Novosphingobium profundi TaxID=1774954 RepID=UPI001BDA3A8C|nr:YceI family protein [Novosphingobium profundi]